MDEWDLGSSRTSLRCKKTEGEGHSKNIGGWDFPFSSVVNCVKCCGKMEHSGRTSQSVLTSACFS